MYDCGALGNTTSTQSPRKQPINNVVSYKCDSIQLEAITDTSAKNRNVVKYRSAYALRFPRETRYSRGYADKADRRDDGVSIGHRDRESEHGRILAASYQ